MRPFLRVAQVRSRYGLATYRLSSVVVRRLQHFRAGPVLTRDEQMYTKLNSDDVPLCVHGRLFLPDLVPAREPVLERLGPWACL